MVMAWWVCLIALFQVFVKLTCFSRLQAKSKGLQNSWDWALLVCDYAHLHIFNSQPST
jgi:heme/copper-type cytochrome/quinol oxidase subunit 4